MTPSKYPKTNQFLTSSEQSRVAVLYTNNGYIRGEVVTQQLVDSAQRDVIDQLRCLVSSYLLKHSNLSTHGLASKASVSTSTLRRLLQGKIHKEISPYIVLRLVSYIYRENRVKRLLEGIPDPLGTFLKNHFSGFIFDQDKFNYSPNLNEELEDRLTYLIYKLAANHCGVSEIEIATLFGKLGHDRTQVMIEKGLLEKDQSRRLHATQKNFSLDIEQVKLFSQELVQFFKPNAIQSGQNLLYSLSEALNEEGVQKVKMAKKEAIKKVSEVMQDKRYLGEIPYFSIFVCDTLQLNSQGEQCVH